MEYLSRNENVVFFERKSKLSVTLLRRHLLLIIILISPFHLSFWNKITRVRIHCARVFIAIGWIFIYSKGTRRGFSSLTKRLIMVFDVFQRFLARRNINFPFLLKATSLIKKWKKKNKKKRNKNLRFEVPKKSFETFSAQQKFFLSNYSIASQDSRNNKFQFKGRRSLQRKERGAGGVKVGLIPRNIEV